MNINQSREKEKRKRSVHLWKPEEPHDAVWDPVEDVDPHLEGARIDLVQLVEVAVHFGVVG